MENSKYLVLAVVSMAVMLTSQAVNAQKVFQINRFVDSVLTLRYWRADNMERGRWKEVRRKAPKGSNNIA